MRDVDNISSTTIATDGSPVNLIWDKTSRTNDMYTAMDYFCMSCHDSNGAIGIAVKADDSGVTLTPTQAERDRPFNSSDDVGGSTLGGTVSLAGY